MNQLIQQFTVQFTALFFAPFLELLANKNKMHSEPRRPIIKLKISLKINTCQTPSESVMKPNLISLEETHKTNSNCSFYTSKTLLLVNSSECLFDRKPFKNSENPKGAKLTFEHVLR